MCNIFFTNGSYHDVQQCPFVITYYLYILMFFSVVDTCMQTACTSLFYTFLLWLRSSSGRALETWSIIFSLSVVESCFLCHRKAYNNGLLITASSFEMIQYVMITKTRRRTKEKHVYETLYVCILFFPNFEF